MTFDGETDYPMAIGVIVGYSTQGINLLGNYNWAEVTAEALENTAELPEDRERVMEALAIVLALGTCPPGVALTRLRGREQP